MSVYLFIAIALSAMSAVTEVQVARPRLAHVQTVRAEQREVRTIAAQRPVARGHVGRALARLDGLKPVLHPSAAPRAPARS